MVKKTAGKRQDVDCRNRAAFLMRTRPLPRRLSGWIGPPQGGNPRGHATPMS